MITRLKISNFRGVDGLEVKDLPRFTIITGTNGTGKSSLLEAGMLLAGRYRPAFIANLQVRRGIGLILHGGNLDLNGFFGNYKGYGDAVVEGIEDDHLVSIRINCDKAALVLDHQHGKGDSGNLHSTNLRIETTVDGSVDSELFPSVEVQANGAAKMFLGSANMASKRAIIQHPLSSSPLDERDIERFGEVVTEGEEERVAKMMGIIHPMVRSIRAVPERDGTAVKAGLKNVKELVPLALLGGGATNVFKAITNLAWARDGFFAWDEIENGLHISVQREVYRAMFLGAQEMGTQLFMTTHSAEALRALVGVANETLEEDIAVIHLKKDIRGRVTAQTIREKQAVAALSAGYELR